ncbi:C-glycoside deglycosidase beta subunit domain-containing protein [Naasia aerilata]|uniref:C-deglycosylation enzyme beta subunit n=1 Tax=Naasia aerilata TaxID=1162966 RepID=A0ABN6XPQ8_9MICO|nr:DUF6379 domain-containing protein [Naasia aerilata]BDZ46128.1 hypothetical protein GCM10025866_20370 [Naasia aerilata]
MLLERDLIQSVGFRNVREGGEISGFQFRVRMPSYRGMAASLIDGIGVSIPGIVDVEPDVPLWTLQGETHTLAELWESDGLRWPLEDAAIITVPLAGGLPDGVHELSIDLRLRMSYIPAEHQPSRYQVTKHVTLSPEASGSPFRYGVSLYSFMSDYGTVLDLETAMAGIADLGATGIEILGEGHVPNYPNPSQEWVDEWYRLLDRYGLEPTNYGSWIDTRLHSSGEKGRDMTVEEGTAALQRDLRLAKRLGFRFVRPKIGVVSSDLVPHPIWTEVVEASLPLAEELDVIICPEIHSPTPIKHEVVDEYIEFIERTGTKHFGILIDTGIFQDRPIPLSPGSCPAAGPRSSTASTSTRPTSPGSPPTPSSCRRSSTTSTRTSKTSRSRGSPCSRR